MGFSYLKVWFKHPYFEMRAHERKLAIKVYICLGFSISPSSFSNHDLSCELVLPAQHWPSFRGPQAAGVADGAATAAAWDGVCGKNIKWKTSLPGLAHASPVIWGERVFIPRL
jgi:hypothetical protein